VSALVPTPPLELTASDGTGLRLTRLQARAVLQGPLAFTELHLAFENPLDRTLEGTFRIALPVRASLTRFAMKIGESWQEGEIVEKQAARRAYEDFLHRKQDPALLENSAGNEFSARVFPIAARATKEIVVSYAHEIVGDTPYVLPLRGLPKVDAIDVTVSVPGTAAPVAARSEESWTPTEDFVVPHTGAEARDGLRSGDLALVRVRPVVDSHPDPIGSAVVLLDTSASRALGLDDEIREVRSMAERLGEARLIVACFDQSIDEVHAGRARDFGDAAVARIRSRGALGASDLAKALAWAGTRARSAGPTRVIVVSDGVATMGRTDRADIVSAAKALGDWGIERVDAVVVGGIRDEAALRLMTTAGLAHDGVVADGAADAESVVRRLTEATRSHVAVAVEGATWQWPRSIDGAQAGDEFLVYAQVPVASPARISIDGAARPLDLMPADRPMVERAAAEAKIESLLDQEGRSGDATAIRRQVVELSTAQRVLSPYTAMLVLETEWDYQRFHIDRRSLADILTVEGSRVIRTSRSPGVLVAQPGGVARKPQAPPRAEERQELPRAQRATEPVAAPRGDDLDHETARDGLQLPKAGDSFGAGGLGSSGAGEGGGGAGSAASASPPAAPAAAQPAAAQPTPAPRARPARLAAPAEESGMMGLAGSATVNERRSTALAGNDERTGGTPPYVGPFADVMAAVHAHDAKTALAKASAWRTEQPGDALAYVALGEALEASGDGAQASRAYGSLIDLFPSRADLRRFAGERLERVRDEASLDVAIDTYQKAEEERPDHPSSHRLLAYALLKRGRFAQAFDAAVAGLAYPYPPGRFPGVDRILREDVGLIGAAWAHSEPSRKTAIVARVRSAGAAWDDSPSLRFVLSWETDANDVDFHITDAAGNHAFYSAPHLASGGDLYADVTTGYGPECFAIHDAPGHRAGPYRLQAHYYSRGTMGYGMGKVEIIEHDGHGGLKYEERPFVVMNDRAFVDLGTAR